MGTGTQTKPSKSQSDLRRLLQYERWRFPIKKVYRPLIEGKRGIEVGGPSAVFDAVLPLYQFVGELDGVNFASDTIWEGHIDADAGFQYSDQGRGRQFISDATDLDTVPTGAYDFVLSSNCLEHVANPLKAMREWHRVLTSDGVLVLVLPYQKHNFDHRRPVTAFEHLLDDFARDTGEDDLTHLDEILALHDLSMDKPAGNLTQVRERSLANFDNRTLHHHIFDLPLIMKLLDHMEFDVLHTSRTRSDFFALARKRH
jgi:SAM-dependent methyltransferase